MKSKYVMIFSQTTFISTFREYCARRNDSKAVDVRKLLKSFRIERY